MCIRCSTLYNGLGLTSVKRTTYFSALCPVLGFFFFLDRHGDGGGFFLACEDFGGRFDDSFPVRAFFSFFFSVDEVALTDFTF